MQRIVVDGQFHFKKMTIREQLTQLSSLQSIGSETYPNGVFPSQRFHPYLGIVREDDNIFFTACIVHILQAMDVKLSEIERSISRAICEKALSAYPRYRNKDGLDTYNFWQTVPSRHFPNGRIMHRWNHFRIPDDVDDTALVYLTERASRERVGALREKLKHHANLAYRQARNTLPSYQQLQAYSTFIGKNMYIEFDVCVLSNLLRLILQHFPNDLNEYDRDSLHFICEVLRRGEHISRPFQVAPQYVTTPLILYHAARLLPLLPEEYSDVKPIVLSGLRDFHRKLPLGKEKLLVENALLQLGECPALLSEYPMETVTDKGFHYFIAGMLTAFEGPIIQGLAASPMFHLRYRSEAFNRTLLLENTVLRRSA